MNFFKLYIGDYQRDTAHLSVTEHGAYLLMLQHYYATEKPLPTGKALHRMMRAQDKAERDAIDAVVAQFWEETPEGLVNGRADVEITKAGAQAETNRAIAQAREARRKAAREGHEQSTNRAPTSLGAPEELNGNLAEKSQKSASDFCALKSVDGLQVVDSYGGCNNESCTNRATNDQPNQTPDTRLNTPLPPNGGQDPDGFAEFWAAWPASVRKVDRKKCAEKWRRCKFSAISATIIGHVEAMKLTRQWQDGYEPKPLTYLNGERWADGGGAEQPALIGSGEGFV